MIFIYINFDETNKEYTCSYLVDDIITTSSHENLFNCVWSVLVDLRKNKTTNRLFYTNDDLKFLRIYDNWHLAYEYDINTLLEYAL